MSNCKPVYIWGDTASAYFRDGEPLSQVREHGTVASYEFQTEAEAAAFKQGVEAAEGWMGWTEVDPEDHDAVEAGKNPLASVDDGIAGG